MTLGEKIRAIRLFRGLTQKELGELVNQLDVRIREYESNRRTPKADKIKEFAKALRVSYSALYPNSVYEEFFEALFWAEFELGEINIFPFDSINEQPKDMLAPIWKYNAKYNLYDEDGDWSVKAPMGVTFMNSHINEFLKEWFAIKNELKLGKITEDEYFEWKINWPESSKIPKPVLKKN